MVQRPTRGSRSGCPVVRKAVPGDEELRRDRDGRAAAGLKNSATRRKMGIGADPAQRWPEAVNEGHEVEQAASFMASPIPVNKRRR